MSEFLNFDEQYGAELLAALEPEGEDELWRARGGGRTRPPARRLFSSPWPRTAQRSQRGKARPKKPRWPLRGGPVRQHGRGCSCARCRAAGGHVAGCRCARCRRAAVAVGRYFDSAAPFDMPEQTGGDSERVRWVQSTLNRVLSLRLSVDGVMSPAVRSAVRDFQRREGLPEDGIVGPPTEQALTRAAGGATKNGSAQGGEPDAKNGNGGAPANDAEPRPADGDTPPPQDGGGGGEGEFAYGPQGRPGARTARGTRAGQRCTVLSGFDFDRDALKPQHQRQLAAAARQIATGKVRSVRVIGYTDRVGTDAYNLTLGRRRAAQAATALRSALERVKPGLGRSTRISVESRGEHEPIPGNAVGSRRVEICYTSGTRPRREEGSCGVPQRSALGEIALEVELDELEVDEFEAEAPPPTVLSRLSLYQNTSNTSHRNHFLCGASRQARRIAAIASPAAVQCRRRVGATPYDSGADIVRAITNAYHCLRQRPVDVIHIFGHSGSNGVYGTTGGMAGLYSAGETGIDTASGGRTVSDVPVAFLAQNVVFVLHGCNQASGADNFAKSLYDHLAATLRNPRVYGHTNSGCASRNNSWREYSRRNPNGRNAGMPAAIYTDVGCCGR